MKRFIPTLALSLGASLLASSALAQGLQKNIEVIFNVTSDDNPSEVRKRYKAFHQIVEDEVNSRLTDKQVYIRLAIAPSYEISIEQMASGEAQFGRLTPVVYLAAKQQNPDLELLAGEVLHDGDGDTHTHGVLVVHQDSPIQSLEDLKGKSIAFMSPMATSGRFHAQAHLRESGLGPADFSKFEYLGRNDKIIEAVAAGEFDVGATTFRTYLHDSTKEGMPVRKLAEYVIPHNPWVVNTSLPEDVRDALRATLLEMDEEKLQILGVDAFVAVDDAEYTVTQEAMKYSEEYAPAQ